MGAGGQSSRGLLRRYHGENENVHVDAVAHVAMNAQIRASSVPPRVLIVSRAYLRKNKVVDFVGEYHTELLVRYGVCPIVVPRTKGMVNMLDAFEPIHGVLLIEGQDIDPALYNDDEVVADVKPWETLHAGDTALDHSKDEIEFELTKRCIERNIPFLGICRGSQVINVLAGGTLYSDVESELGHANGNTHVKHVDYDNYDGHRHPIEVIEGTPLFDMFREKTLNVNSYHHQGVKKLAPRFSPMAYAADGLIEAFYDPTLFEPESGKFVLGLQFHPERLRDGNDQLEYSGCSKVYELFAKAVRSFQLTSLQAERIEFERQVETEYSSNMREESALGDERIGMDIVESIVSIGQQSQLALYYPEFAQKRIRNAFRDDNSQKVHSFDENANAAPMVRMSSVPDVNALCAPLVPEQVPSA